MAFNPRVESSPSPAPGMALMQAQQKDDADSTALVLRGRGVVVSTDYRLATGPLSIFDKTMSHIGLSLGMDISSLRQCTSKVMKPLIPLFKQLEQQMAFSRGEDDENSLALVQVQLQDHVRRIQEQARGDLALAGVKTYSELMDKSKIIEGFKARAWQKFYADPKCTALQVQFDEAMVTACMGEVSKSDKQTIQEYWKMIAAHPKGYEMHLGMEENMITVLMETINQELADYLKSHPPEGFHGDMSYEGLAKSLFAAMQKKEDLLRKQLKTQSDLEQIQTNYMILQGRLIGPTFINMTVKNILEDTVRQREVFAEHMLHDFVIPQDNKLINDYIKQMSEYTNLEGIEKLIDSGNEDQAFDQMMKEADSVIGKAKQIQTTKVYNDAEIRKLISCSRFDKLFRMPLAHKMYDFILDEVIDHAERVKEYGESITHMKSRDKKKYAYEISGIHPDVYKKLIPNDTKYEKMVRTIYGLNPEQMNKKKEKDIHLDLSKIADPLAYFFNKMVEEIQMKLKEAQAAISIVQVS